MESFGAISGLCKAFGTMEEGGQHQTYKYGRHQNSASGPFFSHSPLSSQVIFPRALNTISILISAVSKLPSLALTTSLRSIQTSIASHLLRISSWMTLHISNLICPELAAPPLCLPVSVAPTVCLFAKGQTLWLFLQVAFVKIPSSQSNKWTQEQLTYNVFLEWNSFIGRGLTVCLLERGLVEFAGEGWEVRKGRIKGTRTVPGRCSMNIC